LPARVAGYDISWLDDLCRSGRLAWTRLRAAAASRDGGRSSGPVRASPIVLVPRRQLALWSGLVPPGDDAETASSSRAQGVADWLTRHGASFFDELKDGAHLLQTELEDALAELVAQGRVHADSFAGLRALLVPSSQRPSKSQRRHGRRSALFGIADAGRWALIRRSEGAVDANERIEHIARVLLRRYGVVCWRLLEREATWLPPWRDLRRVYHRLEARGEIRGGRFIAGVVGEQFALPEAVATLRRVRQRTPDGVLVCVCGADPLNLVGSILAGSRVPTLTSARVLYRDGVPLATLVAGEIALLESLDPSLEWQVRVKLQRETHAQLAVADL
jgi:ATP-dependent Lhr-like helicase